MLDLRPKASLKGRLPFRLGTTSYIIPDAIMPNLYYLRDQVDDVELVLFESDEFSNLPTARDVVAMRDLAQRHELSYTVHLPLDTRLGSADETERISSVGKCRRIIERAAQLEPRAYVLHLHGDRRGDIPADDISRWQDQNRRSIADLIGNSLPARMLCVENLDYNFELIAGVVKEFDLAVCIDIGHLVLTHRNVEEHLERWLDRARVIHLHGVRDDCRDHVNIGYLPPELIDTLAARLPGRDHEEKRVVTLEIFGEDEFLRSMDVIQERLERWLR